MHDDHQSEIQRLLALLNTHKQSLAVLEQQAAQQGSLYQISPNFNEILSRKTTIRQLQAELAHLTLVPIIADLNHATLSQYYREAFGTIQPHGSLAHVTNINDIVEHLFKDTDSAIATAFFMRVLQDYPHLAPLLEPALATYAQPLSLRWVTLHPAVHTLTRRDDTLFQIALDPHPLYSDQFRVRAWLRGTSRATKLLTEDDTYTSSLDGLKQRILALYGEVSSRSDIDSTHLTIDVFLPMTMLSAGIHLWGIEEYDGIPSELGFEHPVHIRFYERSFKGDPNNKKARDRWKDKWRSMISAPRTSIYRLTNVQELFNKGLLYRTLDQKVCYVECCGRHRQYEARTAVMVAGIGMGLWLTDDATDECDDWTDLDTFACTALPLDTHFPVTMFALCRNDQKPWVKPLVVLWDDPACRPYDIDNPDDPNTPQLVNLA